MNKEREITQRMREIARQCRAILSMGSQPIGKRLERPLTRTEEERFDRLHARWLELKAERNRLRRRTKRPPSKPRPAAFVVRASLMRQALRNDGEQASESATHEASHAVSGVIEGLGVRRVELLWRLDRGRYKNIGGQCVLREPDRASAQFFLAGREGVLLCRRWASHATGFRSDEANARLVADRRGLSLQQEAERARRLLKRHWGAVAAVSNALLREGTIDGTEVEQLVRRYSRAA